MDFPGFCGPSYQLTNRYSAVERTVNWFCVPNETGGDERKFKVDLSPFPANAAFCTLPVPAPYNQPNRGLLELRGVCYGVNGTIVFSINSAGTFTNIGTVQNDGKPVSMVANGTGQIFIASAGLGYVIPNGGGAGSLIPILTTSFLGASDVTFQDGYFLVITPNSNQFQISGTDTAPLGDGTVWDAANISVQAGQADLISALLSWREYVYMFGLRRSQVYYNAGPNAPGGFPFQSYNDTFMEEGLAAPFSLQALGDSIIWISEDARGRRGCWRTSTFQPLRISTFAVEQAWQGYSTVADAVAFPFTWMGHVFYQVTFPAANATWVYDATASQLMGRQIWCERQFLNAQNQLGARPEMFHCFCYGQHLVGSGGTDGNPGAIYQYSLATPIYDCGVDIGGAQRQVPVVYDRICPHMWEGNKRVIYDRIEFEMLRGVALDGGGAGSAPVVMLRWSNDGGYTFGPEHTVPIGLIGQYGWRAYFLRCGYARDRVFWLRCSDPVYWSITAAELELRPCSA